MAFFYCTSYKDTAHLGWVETAYGNPYIPDNFLDSYQDVFRILVFDASEPVNLQTQLEPKLAFEKFKFKLIDPTVAYEDTTYAGGIPAWEWGYNDDDELYKSITYMGGGVDFLMQIERDWIYKRLPHEPVQSKDLERHGANHPLVRSYFPFMGAFMYFLGTNSPHVNPPQVLLYLA